MTNTVKMIQVMQETGDYPKSRLNSILTTERGVPLEYEVTKLFASWTFNLPIPERKHPYYTLEQKGEWQSWSQQINTQ